MTPFAAALAIALSVVPSADAARVGRDPKGAAGEIDVSGYPAQQRANYAVVRQKCGGCHPLARALGPGLPPEALKRHVRRMGRRPGSALSDAQARAILGFVEYHARRSAPPR